MSEVSDTQLIGSSRVTRRSTIPWKALGEVGVVLDIESGDYFELDAVGFAIWQRLDGALTLAECAAEIAEVFEADAAVVERDVIEFVEVLRFRNLVTVASA